jgi:hypothetical protein
MRHEHWLKSFAVELRHRRPDIGFNEVDLDFLRTVHDAGKPPSQVVFGYLPLTRHAPISAGHRPRGGRTRRLQVAWIILVAGATIFACATLAIGRFYRGFAVGATDESASSKPPALSAPNGFEIDGNSTRKKPEDVSAIRADQMQR